MEGDDYSPKNVERLEANDDLVTREAEKVADYLWTQGAFIMCGKLRSDATYVRDGKVNTIVNKSGQRISSLEFTFAERHGYTVKQDETTADKNLGQSALPIYKLYRNTAKWKGSWMHKKDLLVTFPVQRSVKDSKTCSMGEIVAHNQNPDETAWAISFLTEISGKQMGDPRKGSYLEFKSVVGETKAHEIIEMTKEIPEFPYMIFQKTFPGLHQSSQKIPKNGIYVLDLETASITDSRTLQPLELPYSEDFRRYCDSMNDAFNAAFQEERYHVDFPQYSPNNSQNH